MNARPMKRAILLVSVFFTSCKSMPTNQNESSDKTLRSGPVNSYTAEYMGPIKNNRGQATVVFCAGSKSFFYLKDMLNNKAETEFARNLTVNNCDWVFLNSKLQGGLAFFDSIQQHSFINMCLPKCVKQFDQSVCSSFFTAAFTEVDKGVSGFESEGNDKLQKFFRILQDCYTQTLGRGATED